MDVSRFVGRPAGVEAFRESLGLRGSDILIAKLARLAERKGHTYLIEAAQRLADDARVHVCFVGDGVLRSQLEHQVERAGLTGRVHFTGLLDPEQIPCVLHASDIVAHCALREGLPRSLPQAMLAGVAVVCFDLDGAPEVVDPTTGVLVDPENIAQLTAALRVLIESPDLRRRLGQAGRQRCIEQFDHARMVDAIESLYETLLATAGPM
jgi:glycosyltransferase involved in cell wall biosynthesis